MGDGSSYDPCVDPYAPRTVVVAMAVFGGLLLLVVLDGLLLRYGNIDVLGCCFGFRGRRYGWWRAAMAKRIPKRLMYVLLAGWYLFSGAAIVVDVVFDAILLSQLLPLAVGYAMLATLCCSFLAVGLAVHLFLISYVSSASGDSWLLRLYRWLAQQDWLMLAASLLLVPLLAAMFDVLLVTTALVQLCLALYHACSGSFGASLAPDWLLLGAFSLPRCFALRSLLTVVLQSWPSIGFTTWGYLALHKYAVGRFITVTIFLANLGTSMAHTLLAAWSMKELWVKHGSWAAALREVFCLAPGGAGQQQQGQQGQGQGLQKPQQDVAAKDVIVELEQAGYANAAAGPPVERMPESP